MTFTRDMARGAIALSGLRIAELEAADFAQLRKAIDNELADAGLMNGTFRARQAASIRKTDFGRVAAIRCSSYYFFGREAVTFNHDGFVRIAGWADEVNVAPILKALSGWTRKVALEQAAARGTTMIGPALKADCPISVIEDAVGLAVRRADRAAGVRGCGPRMDLYAQAIQMLVIEPYLATGHAAGLLQPLDDQGHGTAFCAAYNRALAGASEPWDHADLARLLVDAACASANIPEAETGDWSDVESCIRHFVPMQVAGFGLDGPVTGEQLRSAATGELLMISGSRDRRIEIIGPGGAPLELRQTCYGEEP